VKKFQIFLLSYVNDKNQYSNVQGRFGTMLVNNLMKMVPSCHLGLKDACYFQLPKPWVAHDLEGGGAWEIWHFKVVVVHETHKLQGT